MNNLHTPVARAIEQLQFRWVEATKKNPAYKLIRWLTKPDDDPLINGFYKLESSPYGRVPDFFLVMLTPFEAYDGYARQLIHDLIEAWQKDEAVQSSKSVWQTDVFKEKLEKGGKPDVVLAEMLIDFRERFCRPDQVLVLGLLPRLVKDMSEFNYRLIDLAEMLPENIKICLTDHVDKNYHKAAFKYFKEKTISLNGHDLNLGGMIRQMATAGHESNPEADFRRCIFEMADGAAAKSRDRIDTWGKKALLIAQKSGNKNLMATAYLIYAGFYLHFKRGEADELLDKGILIAENEYKRGDPDITAILLQLYGYKSACRQMRGNKTQAAQWAFKQARLSVEKHMGTYAVSACCMAARMAKSAWEDRLYFDCLRLGYQAGDSLTTEELKLSEITMIAYHYMAELRKDKQNDEAGAIDGRMKGLFGEKWDENIKSFSSKGGQTIPDMNQTIETMHLNQ